VGERSHGARGLLIATAALGLPLVPLFLHRSSMPRFGSYGTAYAVGLAAVTSLAVIAAWLVGRTCARSRSTRPAVFLALGVAAVGLLAVALDLLAGFWLPDPFAEYRAWGQRRSIVFGFENEPSRQWARVGARYATDELGFRVNPTNPDWYRRETGGGTRIFAIGASSVFGFGLDDDEAWPQLLQSELRERRPGADVLVVNAGNNGHNSLTTLLRFYLRVLPHHPTHVVLYLARNEVRSAKVSLDDVRIRERILFSTTYRDYIGKSFEGRNFYYRTHLGYLANRALDRVKRVFRPAGDDERHHDPGPSEAEREVLEYNGASFIFNVRTITDLCRREGVRPILATFAFAPEVPPTAMERGVRYYNDLLRRFAAEEDLLLVDLAARVEAEADRERLFFQDRYHPSREGARYLASRFAEAIAPHLEE